MGKCCVTFRRTFSPCSAVRLGKSEKNQEPAAAAAAALQCSAKDKRCWKDSQRFVGLAKELGQAEAGVRGGRRRWRSRSRVRCCQISSHVQLGNLLRLLLTYAQIGYVARCLVCVWVCVWRVACGMRRCKQVSLAAAYPLATDGNFTPCCIVCIRLT